MTHLLPFLLCIAGFTALAFAVNRQQDNIFNRSLAPPLTRWLRVAGACWLLLGLVLIVVRQGWGMGLVLYSGYTSVAAGAVYCALLAYETRQRSH